MMPLLKAKNTSKLVRKEITNKNGKRQTVWVSPYVQTKSNNQRRIEAAKRAPLITGVQPLKVNANNVYELAHTGLSEISNKIKSREGVFCPALSNRKISGVVYKHLGNKGSHQRDVADIAKRVQVLPFVIPVIEQGVYSAKRLNKKYGGFDYEIVGRCEINGKKRAVVVIVSDKGQDLLYVSVFSLDNKMLKSVASVAGPTTAANLDISISRGQTTGFNGTSHTTLSPVSAGKSRSI